MLIKRILIFILKRVIFPLMLFYVLNIKKPLLFKIRHLECEIFFMLFTLSLVFFFVNIWGKKRLINFETICFGLIIIANTIYFSSNYFQYQDYKNRVFNAETAQVKRLGRHFITGYTNEGYADIKELVRIGGLGGIYLTKRNFDGKNFFEIKEEIDTLQKIQKKNGLPPLFVATDQEGGVVSRASPPLVRLPGLSTLVEMSQTGEALEAKVKIYANIQSIELAEVGINVNLSPVVDLKTSGPHDMNFHTRIDLRSISNDVQIVTDVAMIYSEIFEKNGVIPTLKHFPGLGGVEQDTHLFTGILSRDKTSLNDTDWLPFREISNKTGAFIMLGHVLLTSIDENALVSYSKKVITGLIRETWLHNGVLITDDLNMGPVVKSDGGIGAVSVKALNAGADLLLISYDGEQYYKALCDLIEAEERGALDMSLLAKSQNRLNKALSGMTRI